MIAKEFGHITFLKFTQLMREVQEECRSQKVLSVGQYFIKHISLMLINSNYVSKH